MLAVFSFSSKTLTRFVRFKISASSEQVKKNWNELTFDSSKNFFEYSSHFVLLWYCMYTVLSVENFTQKS